MGTRDRDAIAAYLDAYRGEVATARYAELTTLQPPPLATLAHGGAGTAYALARLGDVAAARTWASASARDRRRAAFAAEPGARAGGAFLYGRAGAAWARALVAADRARAAGDFARCRVDEHGFAGAAGVLAGARLVLARGAHPALHARASAIAADLARRVRARRRWRAPDAVGFAHGWPGILHALVAWTRDAPPTWLVDALRALRAAWRPDVAPVERLAGSWCNGAAGTALLWCAAHDATGDADFARAASAAAERAAHAPSVGFDLCCGLTGVAGALLAVDRVDPRGGWRARAIAIVARAIATAAPIWPCGLFRGHAGLACVALDALEDDVRGFPTVDA